VIVSCDHDRRDAHGGQPKGCVDRDAVGALGSDSFSVLAPDLMTAVLSPTPLLEREDSLARLRASIAEAVAGRGQMILVMGEAGVGKTALVQCLSEACADNRVWMGACERRVAGVERQVVGERDGHDQQVDDASSSSLAATRLDRGVDATVATRGFGTEGQPIKRRLGAR
jgi:hypothetical protein